MTKRIRRAPAGVAVCALVVVGALLWSHSHDKAAASATSAPTIVIANGEYDGNPWYLLAYTDKTSGQLCMYASSTPKLSQASGVSGGQCGFYSGPGVNYYFSAQGLGDAVIDFGPLPQDATQIRVATHEVLATTPLPSGKGLPAGRYWMHIAPANWPQPQDGSALTEPQPLNAQGAAVPFSSF